MVLRPSEEDAGIWPKKGFGTLVSKCRPHREILGGQLIEIRLRQSQPRILRAEVANFQVEIVSERFLDT